MSTPRRNRGGYYVNDIWGKLDASAPPGPDLDSKQRNDGAVPGGSGYGATGKGPVEAEVLGHQM